MIFAMFSDPDRIWILVKFFGSGADYQISISAQHWCMHRVRGRPQMTSHSNGGRVTRFVTNCDKGSH